MNSSQGPHVQTHDESLSEGTTALIHHELKPKACKSNTRIYTPRDGMNNDIHHEMEQKMITIYHT